MGRARSPDAEGASRHRRAKPDPLDRRLNPRVRTDERATIELDGARIVCAIRDRSPGGARLVLKGRHSLPTTFWLVRAADLKRVKAHLIWTDGLTAGVRLEPDG